MTQLRQRERTSRRNSARISSMLDRNETRRLVHRRRKHRYSLGSLLGVVLVGGILFALLRVWGSGIWTRLERRIVQTREMFPDAKVSELLPPVCILCGLVAGFVLCYIVSHLDVRRSFLLMAGIFFVCVLMFVWALSLDFPAFQETTMKHVSKRQVAFGLVMSFAINLPIFGVVGWWLAAVRQPVR